jgi:hypothetical protein
MTSREESDLSCGGGCLHSNPDMPLTDFNGILYCRGDRIHLLQKPRRVSRPYQSCRSMREHFRIITRPVLVCTWAQACEMCGGAC